MKINNFRDIKVWVKAHDLSLEIYKLTKKYPDEERYGLTSQIRRSAISICANISEGYMKSTNEFIRYLDISRGSLEETKYFLILSKDLFYINDSQYKYLSTLADEIGKMLYALRNNL